MSPLELREGPTPLDESLRRLDALVSPYTGVVVGVEEILAEPSDLRRVNVYCETGHVRELVGHGERHQGGGSGPSRPHARAAAIGEAVERYSACYSDDADVVVGTARELGPRAVRPERFALHSRAQHAQPRFPYAPFTETTPVAWIEAVSLPDGEPAYLPAQLVFLAWSPRRGEARIARSTSNGLACHATIAEAALTGLLELLERDAFAITWLARLSWPLLSWEGNARLEAFESLYVRPTGLRVAAVDLSAYWNVPCVVAVARRACADDAPLGVGAGSAESVEHATEKALDEALRVLTWARALRTADPAGTLVPSAEAIQEFEEHVRYYAYDENAPAVDFLDGSSERRSASDVPSLEGGSPREQIEAICRRLAERGCSAYAVDVTAPDVRAAGLRVVKVIAPELCGLDVEHEARLLGGRRIREEPARLGKCAGPLQDVDLNPDPHPFP